MGLLELSMFWIFHISTSTDFMQGGRAKLTVETSNENFLTPAAYIQNTGTASAEAGGNAFFPADDGLDV